MVRLIQRILGRTSHPLNTIFISKDRLLSNYKTLSKINPKISIAPVLKSNAYGHGLAEVGKILDSRRMFTPDLIRGGNDRMPFICVDSLYEALILRKAGIKSEILIIGYIDPKSLKHKKLNFSFAVWDLETAEVLDKYQKGAKIHIFVDTGMNREGIRLDQLSTFLSQLKLLKNLKIEGLMSHLAVADDPKNPLNKIQFQNFKKAKEIVKNAGFKPKWFHLGGSYALLNLNPKDCNLIRVGKALYGVVGNASTSSAKKTSSLSAVEGIHPVLSFKSKIAQIKNIKKGDKIGYSSTFTAQKDLKIAVLPLGYNDGLDRRLSNKGVVRVGGDGGVGCKILGLISMNVAVIDISEVKNPYLGQEVVIFSDNPKDKNSIQKCAEECGTISYELLVHLHPSTKRIVG